MQLKNIVLLTIILMTVIAKPAVALEWKDLLPPSEQAKQRDEKMFTVGLPVTDPYNMPGHWQFRPTDKLTLGVCYSSGGFQDDEDGRMGEIDRDIEAKMTSYSVYVTVHPLKASGFYIGAGGEMREGTYRLLRPEANTPFWSEADIEESAGTVQAMYGGPSFGWQWLWENGFSLGFDVSKRKRFADEVKVTKKENAGVDEHAGAIKEKLIPESVGGTVMLGYSF